jgi:hypothetical protein
MQPDISEVYFKTRQMPEGTAKQLVVVEWVDCDIVQDAGRIGVSSQSLSCFGNDKRPESK